MENNNSVPAFLQKICEAINSNELLISIDLRNGTLRLVYLKPLRNMRKPAAAQRQAFFMYRKLICPRCRLLIQTMWPAKKGADDSAKPQDIS